jgi:hypothetical protein
VFRRTAQVTICAILILLLVASPADAFPGDGVVSNIAGRGMSYAFQETSQGSWVLEGVAHFTNGIVNFLKTAARPEVDAVWFSGADSPYAAVRQVALSLLLVFAFLGLISGLLQGDVEGMVRRIAGGLPAALFGMVVTTFVVAKLLDLTDALSTAVLAHSGSDALEFLSGFQQVAIATAPQGFPALLLGFIAIISALLRSKEQTILRLPAAFFPVTPACLSEAEIQSLDSYSSFGASEPSERTDCRDSLLDSCVNDLGLSVACGQTRCRSLMARHGEPVSCRCVGRTTSHVVVGSP